MAEHLFHVAACEDAIRLLIRSDDFHPLLSDSITSEYDCAILGSGSRGNHLYAVPILEEMRDAINAGSNPPHWRQRTAYAIGWLMHRATDHLSKPLYRAVDSANNPAYSGNEYRIYHDAVVFREVYQAGRRSTESPYEIFTTGTLEEKMKSLPASSSFQINEMETLLALFWQADLMRLYRFTDGNPGSDEWLEAFEQQFPVFQEELPLYLKAFQNPDPDRMKKYIEEPNFYNPEDELIKVVRAIQAGEEPANLNVPELLRHTQEVSNYAAAVKMSYEYAKGGSDFFAGKIEKKTCYDIVHMEEINRH